MYTLIIFLAVGGSLGIYRSIKYDAGDNSFTSAVVGGFIFFLLFLLFNHMMPKPEWQYGEEITEIVTLQDNMASEGSFFLGSGSVNGTMKYTYYTEFEEGKFKMGFEDYNCPIIYDSSAFILKKYKYREGSTDWVAFSKKEYITTEIHVPKGTIKHSYNLDAK